MGILVQVLLAQILLGFPLGSESLLTLLPAATEDGDQRTSTSPTDEEEGTSNAELHVRRQTTTSTNNPSTNNLRDIGDLVVVVSVFDCFSAGCLSNEF